MAPFQQQYQQKLMQGHFQADSSINQILEMLKNYKPDMGKSRDLSEFSLDAGDWLVSTKRSQGNAAKEKELPRFTTGKPVISAECKKPVGDTAFYKAKKQEGGERIDRTFEKVAKSDLNLNTKSKQSHINTTGTTSTHNPSKLPLYNRLFEEKKQQEQRRHLLQYETRRSIQQKERRECTFSPNLKRVQDQHQHKMRASLDLAQAEQFYNRNLQWLQRRQKSIKLKQCERDVEKVDKFTFIPKINKYESRAGKQNVVSKKGVQQFLSRQTRAKRMTQYVQSRKKHPYSHVWNIKQGYFSYNR